MVFVIRLPIVENWVVANFLQSHRLKCVNLFRLNVDFVGGEFFG